jgi:eukaryotic-like serine/threonine-protein kinase
VARDTTIPIHTGPMEVEVGAELGSYRLVSLLGKGAMGRVFRARHVKLGREVAIKVLNPEYAARPDVVQRFFREAWVVNQIGHEHIVDVTDLVELPGCAFLVMELLDGQSLRQVLKRRRRRWPAVHGSVEVMAQVCQALEAAHQRGVVHRDLKPDNVFVVKRGGKDYAKVLDFGVAKLREPDAASTVSGMILGTPLYMSPEQAGGEEVDRAADIWAAGVVLYEMLSGSVPFQGGSFAQLAAKIREEPAPPLPQRTPRGERIPPELATAVMRCLEKKPSDRFRSMAALGEALGGTVAGAQPAGGGRRLVALAAFLALVAAAAVAMRHDPSRWLAPFVENPTTTATPTATAAPTSAPTPTPTSTATQTPSTPPATQTPSTPPATQTSSTPPPTSRTAKATAGIQRPKTPARLASVPPEHPKKVEKVEVELYSKPSGAAVVRLDTGARLGKTPARVKLTRRNREVALRFTLEGYEPITASVDLQTGGSATVAMRPKKAGHRRSRKH